MSVDKPVETNSKSATQRREEKRDQPVGGGRGEGEIWAWPSSCHCSARSNVVYFSFLSLSLSHLAQKSIEGFIAEPAFRPNDNIIPVTLTNKILTARLHWLGLIFDNGLKAIHIFDLIFDNDLFLQMVESIFSPEGHEHWPWLQLPLNNGGEGEQEERGGNHLFLDISDFRRNFVCNHQ